MYGVDGELPEDNDATQYMTDRELLARVAWGEARSLGSKGMQATINVIMNRVHRKSWFGKTINEVIRKPWQFSCLNIKDPNRSILLSVTEEDKEYAEALRLAGLALAGDLPDITNRADSYYATSIKPPRWADGKTPTAIIGAHRYYVA